MARGHVRLLRAPSGGISSAWSSARIENVWVVEQGYVFLAVGGELLHAPTFLAPLRAIDRVDPARFNRRMRGRFVATDGGRLRVLAGDQMRDVAPPPEARGDDGRGDVRQAWFTSEREGRVILEDGSRWGTTDGGATWTRGPNEPLPEYPNADALARWTVPLPASFEHEGRLLRWVHDPTIALHEGGLRTDEGDIAVIAGERPGLLLLRPDEAPRTVRLPDGRCVLRPWGRALAVMCQSVMGVWSLSRLRDGALTPVDLSEPVDGVEPGDDGIHWMTPNSVCDADVRVCWRCAGRAGSVLHGADRFVFEGDRLRRCTREGVSELRLPPDFRRCEHTELDAHASGLVVSARRCRDALGLPVPDRMARVRESLGETRLLPFDTAMLMTLDAQHMAAVTTGSRVMFTADEGRSWASLVPTTLDQPTPLRTPRCSGGACQIEGLGVISMVRGSRPVREEREAVPSPPPLLGPWLRAEAVDCEISRGQAMERWIEESLLDPAPVRVHRENDVLWWRSAEGVGSARVSEALRMWQGERALGATATDVWIDAGRTIDGGGNSGRGLVHVGANGTHITLRPEGLPQTFDATVTDDGGLLWLGAEGVFEDVHAWRVTRGGVVERRVFPRDGGRERLSVGALDGRPAVVRTEFVGDGLRVTAHTFDGTPDRSWRRGFSREAHTPWCEAEPELWWQTPIDGPSPVRFSPGSLVNVTAPSAAELRVGVHAGRLCVQRWRAQVARFEVGQPPSLIVASVRAGVGGMRGQGTSARAEQWFQHTLRCAR